MDQDDVPAPDVKAAQALPRQPPRRNLSARLARRALPLLACLLVPRAVNSPASFVGNHRSHKGKVSIGSNIGPILIRVRFSASIVARIDGNCLISRKYIH